MNRTVVIVRFFHKEDLMIQPHGATESAQPSDEEIYARFLSVVAIVTGVLVVIGTIIKAENFAATWNFWVGVALIGCGGSYLAPVQVLSTPHELPGRAPAGSRTGEVTQRRRMPFGNRVQACR